MILSFLLPSLLTLAGCSNSGVKRSESSPLTKKEKQESTESTPAPEQSAKVVVSFSLAQAHLSLHEPVFLNFTIENRTSDPVVVDLGANHKEAFLFAIVKPDGSKAELPQMSPEGSALVGKARLRPGQKYSRRLLLNEWSEFDSLGQYEISVRLIEPHKRLVPLAKPDIYNIYDTPEFRTTLDIGPRDETRLNKTCADLEIQTINADLTHEVSDAAKALTLINDPVAIPYLERIKSLRSRGGVVQ